MARVVVTGWLVLNVALIAIGALLDKPSLTAPVRRWDLDVSRWLADRRTDTMDDVTGFISRSGDTEFVIGTIVVISICIALIRAWRSLWLVPLAITIEVTTFLVVNSVVGRDRPDVPRLGSTPSTSSFPSGHVAATLVVWLGAAFLLRRAERQRWAIVLSVIGVIFALAMGFARIYQGMHHLLDVVFGLAMGVAALAIAREAFDTDQERQPERPAQPERKQTGMPEQPAGSATGLVDPEHVA